MRRTRKREIRLGLELGVRVLFGVFLFSGISALYLYSWLLIY
jgi:hypothetical protein